MTVAPNGEPPVYVGLGANLGDPERTLAAAAEELSRLPDVALHRRSSLYAAAPVGPSQPEFRNAVVSLLTPLAPPALLAALLDIERAHGRVRTERWGPRVLDLDILLWGNRVVDEPGLHVPHPGQDSAVEVADPLVAGLPRCRQHVR